MENNTITFEVNGINYAEDIKTNRYYKVVDGKKVRIGKDEYTTAFDQYLEEAKQEMGIDEADGLEVEVVEDKPKKKRTKKSKGSTFDGIEITALQQEFIKHLPDTDFWEHGLDSSIWIDILCDQIGGEFAGKPMRVGAMVSTLREKGIFEVGVQKVNGKKAKFLVLTDVGKKIAKQLGLEG